MTLVLLPNLLGSSMPHTTFLPPPVDEIMTQIDGLIAESEGGGRSYLRRFKTKKKTHEIPIALLNEHSSEDLDFFLEPVIKGETWGVVSDCGLPCLADPGASLVLRARQLNIPIQTFSGPSSLMLALMASGLPAQRFSFRGYIAKEAQQRTKELLNWEKESRKEKATQIFIEAPYRNEWTLKACIEHLNPNTFLSIGCALTTPDELIKTLPISVWRKKTLPDVMKKPTVFLFYAM